MSQPLLGNTELKRPHLHWNKPVIARPQFDASKPGARVKRQSVIRGAGGNRCYACSALLPLDDSYCPTCGRTQIDIGLLNDAKGEEGGALWKKRIKYLGAPRKGYNGV